MVYKCLKCKKVFGSRKTIRDHIKKEHNTKSDKFSHKKNKVSDGQKYVSSVTALHERVVEVSR